MPHEVVKRSLRFDLSQGNLDKRRTTEGGIIVDANISRVGIFKYQNADGSERRELRDPKEVFKKKALDSFAHATLTVEHPPELVSPKTWKAVTVGHVGDTVHPDGKFVAAELYIQDDATIDRIAKGDLRELSCGYQCRLDMTPGTHPEYGDYDARQTDIIGNHVAIGGKDWGRAGPEVRMHVDSASGEDVAIGSYVPRMPAAKPKTRNDRRAAAPLAPTTEEHEDSLEEEEEIEELAPLPRTRGARSDRLEGENEQLRKENERLRADKDKRTDAQKQADEQARVDARVSARVDLIAKVAPILTEQGKAAYRGDGKTDDEIRRATLAVLEPDVKLDGKSADYVIGVFDSALARVDRVGGKWRELGDVLDPSKRSTDLSEEAPRRDKKKDEDGDEDETVEDAQASMVAKQRDAWRAKPKADRARPDKRDRGGRR